MNTSEPPLSRRSLLVGALALGAAGCDRGADVRPQVIRASNVGPAAPAVTRATAERAVVTMLGDSITAGYGLSSAQSLPVQLEAALDGLGVAVRVRGAGVSGDTTAGGLARVNFSVQDDSDVVVVALGGNDLLQGVEPARVQANLDAIIRRLKARGFTVVLAGMRAPPQLGTYAAAYDAVFSELADTHDVYLYPFLLDGVALQRRYNQADGIHPNAEGARRVAAGLAPVVAAAVRREPIAVTATARSTVVQP